MIILAAYMNDNCIVNNNEFFTNIKLFSWIIEIFFYFYNEAGVKNINNKDDQDNLVKNIQKKSMETFQLYIKNKDIDNKNGFEETVKFIFDYSFYLKKRS